MGAPKGNDNASKGRMFFRALNRAIVQEDGLRLRQAAEKLLDLAAAGEPWAVKELADRLDGKATQVIDATVNRRAQELTDDELADIASGSSAGAAEEAEGAGQSSGLH
jgi:hypothetical protein